MIRVRSLAIGAAAALAVPLLLAGCSSSTDGSAPADTPSAANTPSNGPSARASVDPSVKAQLNVKPGEAIIPGSIKSTKQDLGDKCTTAVAPLRDIMAKYKSGFLVPQNEKQTMVDNLNKARTACEADNVQDWADFYANEFAGWFYAKTQ